MNRKKAPEIKPSQKINFSFPEKLSLENGIPLYTISSGIQDVTKIEFTFNAGIWNQPRPLVAKFTAEMLTEGTKNYSAEEIADKLDFYSAFIDKDCDKDKVSFSVTCLNKHLPDILPFIQDIIIDPVFSTPNFELLCSVKKQQFVLNNEKVSYVAKQRFKQLLYSQQHPYGSILNINDFDNLQNEDLKTFHKDFYSSSDCHIIVSGKPDDNIKDILNKFFGKPFGNADPNIKQTKSLQTTNSEKRTYIEKPSAVQSAVRIGKVMFNYTHPDYFSFKILNTIFGGYFGSRLMTNIREDKGYTYGIGSNIISLFNSGYFFITSQVGVEYCRMAIDEIYKEMHRLQQDKVGDKELDLVRNYMQGNLLRSFDGPFAYAEMCKIMIEFGLDNDYYNRYIEKIQTITPDEIIDIAQKYLQPDTMREVIVGKI